MLFSSNVFLFAFLPSVLLVYFICPKKLRNIVLLLWSLVFYGWGEPVYLFLMVATIAVNYLFGMLIHARQQKGQGAKGVLVISIATNLLLLGFFKYAGFVLGMLPFIPKNILPEISLPIGISFYIFQSMSYVIDVYRNDAPVQKNPLSFGTYVTLFPQLIAGPIVRYSDVAAEMNNRRESISDFSAGVQRFAIGMAKKVLLANPMGNFWNLLQAQDGTLAAWMGILAYSLQIYFDFSGYSDMAIGLGKMFGFHFLENFQYPYISTSVNEFWRRWHISLATWFREYVYIPLGGNRKGLPRQLLNLLIVWALTGLWHGANWSYVLWGLYYGMLIVAEKLFLHRLLDRLPKFLRHLYALLLVDLGWVLFYFEDMDTIGAYYRRMFTFSTTSTSGINLILGFLPIMIIAALAATPVATKLFAGREDKPLVRYGKLAVTGVLLLLCVAALASQSYNPFIYFRF